MTPLINTTFPMTKSIVKTSSKQEVHPESRPAEVERLNDLGNERWNALFALIQVVNETNEESYREVEEALVFLCNVVAERDIPFQKQLDMVMKDVHVCTCDDNDDET